MPPSSARSLPPDVSRGRTIFMLAVSLAKATRSAPMTHQRILLVEDDDDAADAITACLRRGHLLNGVVRCDDGASALAWLATSPAPALVLLDIGLPGHVTGFDVLRAVRAVHAGGRRLPVLMVTASNDERDREEAARLGADGYVLKADVATALVRAARELEIGWLLVSRDERAGETR